VTIHAGTRGDGSYYFQPKAITVSQGDDVTLTVVNDDPSTPHDWALLAYDGEDVEDYVTGGETGTIHFRADVPGEFRIVCQVPGHKQAGMEGKLVVQKKGIPDAGLVPVAGALLALAALRRRRGA
jgi:nitrite reductase (NO-forming)